MTKIKVLVDYPINAAKEYRGLSVPQVLYDYFATLPEIELVTDKDPIDVLLVFSGGSHYAHLDTEPFPRPALFSRFKHLIQKIRYGISKINYDRHLRPNLYYEKRITELKKKNPNMKIIIRLDDRYKILCKIYGYDKTVQWIIEQADAIVFQTEYNKTLYTQPTETIFGKEPGKNINNGVIINNGADTDIFKTDGEKLELSGKYKILHVAATGMLRKGLGTVLEFANLLKDNPDIQFYLVGKQPEDPMYGKDISQFSNVHYLGFTDKREELAKIYRSCDVLLFPSLNDCSPNVVIEAMACGLAVVAANSGGTPELIIKKDLQAGILLIEKNPIYALKEVLNNLDLYKSNALQIVDQYHSKEKMGQQFAKLVMNVYLNENFVSE